MGRVAEPVLDDIALMDLDPNVNMPRLADAETAASGAHAPGRDVPNESEGDGQLQTNLPQMNMPSC
jgi:hypothetical protein